MLTKLIAINAMLATIGEAPVSTLEDPVPDAQVAIQVLDEITYEVQETGWSCNTDVCVLLPLDTNGHIPLPSDTMRVSAIGYYNGHSIQARMDPTDGLLKLWDGSCQTFVFSTPLRVTITHGLVYDDLSENLKSYAKARAARVYQQRIMGAGQIDKFLQEQEMLAFIRLTDSESDDEPTNIIQSDYTLAWGRYHARSLI